MLYLVSCISSCKLFGRWNKAQEPHKLPPADHVASALGHPQDNHQKWSNFKALSPRHQAASKWIPRPSKSMQWSYWKQQSPNISEKLVFRIHLKPNPCLELPTSRFRPGNMHIASEMYPKPIKIEAWNQGSPFLCSQVFLDRSMVPQNAKVDATGMPNDTFWVPKNYNIRSRNHCQKRDSKPE